MRRQWIRASGMATAAASLSMLLAACMGSPAKAKLEYLQKGEAYMKQAQYSSAAIEFRNALKIDPKYVEAYYQLAQADIALHNGNSAYSDLSQAITVDPNRSDARLERARLLLSGKQFKPAIDDITYVLKQDPKNVAAHRLMGSVYVEQKQFDPALQEFSKVVSLAPNEATTYLDLALVDMQLRENSNAELNMKKALQVDPKSVPAYIDMANFYRLQNNPAQAEQTLQKGIEADPRATALYLNLAAVLQAQGKTVDADSFLAKLSSELPKSTDVALAIGDFYLQAKNVDRALSEYQRGLTIDAKNLPLRERIEDVYLTTQQTDKAAQVDEQLLKDAPQDVIARIDHGRLLMAQGKASAAVQELQKVVADAGDSPQAHYYLAMAYSEDNNPDQANQELQQTLRVSPSLPIALSALVNLNYSQGKYSVAQLYAEELVQKNQADPSAHVLLGQIYLKLGQTNHARDQFALAEKLAPTNPGVHVGLASLAVAEQHIPEAEKEYQTAVAEAPDNLQVLSDYVNFLIAQKQQAKADGMVSKFVSQHTNQPKARLLMAQMNLMDKNYPAALDEAQKASKLDPKLASAYLEMGQIYENQGNANSAIQAYQQGMSLAPPSAPLITKIANIYMHEGDLQKAIAQFQKALAIDPNFVVAANNLAWIYAEQNKNLDVALGLAQKAKAQDPDVPNFSDTLAWVMFRKGDYAGALPLLQECVKRQPNSAQFHYHLGMVLVAEGQKAKGKEELHSALRMNLDSQDAEEARKALSQE